MFDSFFPFAKPCLDEATIQEVVDSLRSGWITTGPKVQRFEQLLKDYFNAPHALAVSSATAGLHIALLALDLKPGDEVITSSLTFVATLNTIVLAGAKPVLVDINPDTLNLDIDQVAKAITKKTKVLMPVHFAGLPVDLDPLYALAKQHHLRVVEDCAHSIGAEYKGKRLGSFGDIQVFSFHPNKNMTTGEGGVVITRDEVLAKQMERLRFHGIDRTAFDRFSKFGKQDYDVVLPGFKYNMMDIQAALGLHQLPALKGFNEKRKELAERYLEKLKGWKALSLPKAPDYSHLHAWHLMTIRIAEKSPVDRDTFMTKMKEQNVGVGLHYQAVHLFTYYQKAFGFKQGDFPKAESVCSAIVSLPLHPQMTFEDQDKVIAVMDGILNS